MLKQQKLAIDEDEVRKYGGNPTNQTKIKPKLN
jgi:hypothetical protein